MNDDIPPELIEQQRRHDAPQLQIPAELPPEDDPVPPTPDDPPRPIDPFLRRG